MMVHKQRGGKSLRLDREFMGVGRIARSSGTDHLATFKRINAMLTGLYAIGRIDVLAGIRDGDHAPLVVLHLYERGQIDKLPNAATAAGLVPALLEFHKHHECGASHRANIRTSIRHLEKVATKSATIADLPKCIRAVKERMRETPIAFNRLRTQMMAFAADVQGEMSPLWTEVKRIKRFRKAEGNRPRTLVRRPLTVREMDRVLASFVDHEYRRGNAKKMTVIPASRLRAMTWTLATTGMRPKEYWQREANAWEDRGSHVWVHGTKTPAAIRPTFRLDEPSPVGCGEQFFRKAFAAATTKALRVGMDAYSLRRTFASWCESAGLVESRRKAYLGHGPKDVTDLYLQTNVLPFVVEDGEKVARWIEGERQPSGLSLVQESH